MKRIFLIGFLIVILSAFASAETLRVTMLNQDPNPVRSGDVVDVRFKIENLWENTRDDVIIKVMPEFPFTLYSGTLERNLGRLEGGRTNLNAPIETFKLRVDPNAVDGNHEIKVIASSGEAVWEYDDIFYIDVENEKVSLKPYIVSSNLVTSGKTGKFTIEIANTGGYNIESVELTLLDSENYKLLSTTNYVYLGDIDSDDTESEDFDVYVPEDMTEVNIPIMLNYRANNNDFEDVQNLMLKLLTKSEAKRIGLIDNGSNWLIWAIIIILVAAFFVIRKLKKKQR